MSRWKLIFHFVSTTIADALTGTLKHSLHENPVTGKTKCLFHNTKISHVSITGSCPGKEFAELEYTWDIIISSCFKLPSHLPFAPFNFHCWDSAEFSSSQGYARWLEWFRELDRNANYFLLVSTSAMDHPAFFGHQQKLGLTP